LLGGNEAELNKTFTGDFHMTKSTTAVSAESIAHAFYKSINNACQCCEPKNGYRVSCQWGGLHSSEEITKTKHSSIIEEYIYSKEEELTTEFMEDWEITILKMLKEEPDDHTKACENGGY
jgi:hypothetical protein